MSNAKSLNNRKHVLNVIEKTVARCIFTSLFIVTLCCALRAAEMRSWTGSNGKAIEAEFISCDGEFVRLKLKNGKESNVNLSLFSEQDQEYVKKLVESENPFEDIGDAEAVEAATMVEPYGRAVLRVSLGIDGLGAGVLRLEKADAPLNHSEWGELTPSEKMAKTEIRKLKTEVKMCFDFRDPDPLESFFPDSMNDGYRGISLDGKKKLLIFDHKKGNRNVMFQWPDREFDLPLDLVCDVAEFSDECFNLEMDCNENERNRARLSIRVLCSGDSVDDLFEVRCRYADRSEDKNGKLRFRELFGKKDIKIDEPFAVEFQVPQKHPGPFVFHIGKNLALDSNKEQKFHSLGIIRYEVTGYLKVDDLFEKNDPLFDVKIDPKDDPLNMPKNEKFWNKAMSGTVSFDFESNNGCCVIGEGDYMFETKWSSHGNSSMYVLNDPKSIEGVALVSGQIHPKQIREASKLDFSSRSREPNLGDMVVFKNQHGKYAVVKLTRIINRRRTPAPKSVLAFSYVILPEGEDFGRVEENTTTKKRR